MAIFKTNNNVLLLSNLKVMSSSLSKTDGLTRLNRLNTLINLVSCNQKIILVRNPYKRAISVYNSKFRGIKRYEKQGFQNIHYVFLNELNPKKNWNTSSILKAFEELSFDTYLDILHKVHLKDAHTIPQSRLLKQYFINLKRIKIVKIEDDIKLNELFNELHLKVPHTNRSSNNISAISDEQSEIIYTIYKEDFLNFDYNNSAYP